MTRYPRVDSHSQVGDYTSDKCFGARLQLGKVWIGKIATSPVPGSGEKFTWHELGLDDIACDD